jgi:PAS domain S-box-containing protein
MTVDLGAVVTRLQSHYIRGAPPRQVFDTLLPEILSLTGSAFGFIAEVWRDAQGAPYLKVFNLTDIAWDEATRRHVEQRRDSGLEFRNLHSLLGEAVLTQQPVIANDPASDPRRAGLPPGHPPLHAYLGVPLQQGGVLVGVVGLANRPGGYDEALVRLLQPLFGTVAFILGQLQADRERGQAEAALRDREALYRASFESAAIGIARLDAEGRFVEVNRRLCEVLGRSAQDLRELRLDEVVLPQDRPGGQGLLRALRAGALPRVDMEQRFLRPDGSTAWCLLGVAPLPDAGGAPPQWLATLQDISERKQLEGARVAAQASDRANRAKTEFLSRMSHELRTPLNAVLGFAQLLRMNGRDPLTPGQGEQVRHIERAGQHLLAMINDVLDLSRIEEGAMALQLAALEVSATVQEALVLLQTAAAEADVALQVDGGPPLRVRADAQRLRQVLVNLLSNAVKYNRRGGRVAVAWSADEDGRCRIEVTDTGIGLDEAQRAHLFEPFNRLGAERSKVEGAGIGLVITRRLVQLMQGSLQVSSTPGRGSCFSVLLPAAPAAAAEPAAGLGGEDAPAPITDAVVLYVEDNRLNQELLRQVLRLRPALTLLCASTGARALELARHRAPQLLLIDWHLGDMDGAQVLQRLRSEAGLAGCPAVVLSADATRERQEAAVRAGFDAYLTKPFGVTDLLSCLDRLVGPPPTSGFMALR